MIERKLNRLDYFNKILDEVGQNYSVDSSISIEWLLLIRKNIEAWSEQNLMFILDSEEFDFTDEQVNQIDMCIELIKKYAEKTKIAYELLDFLFVYNKNNMIHNDELKIFYAMSSFLIE